MIPQENQNIVVLFRNGLSIEGTVISWSNKKSVIELSGKKDLFIIQKTKNDVFAVKIINTDKQEIAPIQKSNPEPKIKYEEIKAAPAKTYDDIKNLAELKKELNILEKQEIQERLSSHEMSEPKLTTYVLPGSNGKIQYSETSHDKLKNLINKTKNKI